ncbi:glucuronyl hydrolase [Enterococcus sp. 9E7_DIV0242]|uniref:Glucuronyl hydrolase n=1 Tax=Candidatus Enterococcus clewellii TaxID=1834193 RepID=A0A242KC69_9ENTE|nr:glycoside hydrolase family 88 protein [Enterococcus sp. 9E7_DIV0242]OTP18765.1 glucuronyl hydrolase [Enterococcus sp. 9E7_DIV0242]
METVSVKDSLFWLPKEIDYVLRKIRDNQQEFEVLVPPAASKNQRYEPEENTDWTASFWIGMLFLSKELTGSADFDTTINSQMIVFNQRLEQEIELETHDIGFLYILSAIADYRVNGNEASKKMAVKAADLLMKRYSPKAKIIQAWGNLDDPNERGRMIIDCLMNLPLLYFASEVTGDESYKNAAYAHALQTQKYIVRPNYTTYHTYFFDTETGEALDGKTAQGYSDSSCWARGQAWGIYGFTLSYLYTGDASFLVTAKHLADYFIDELPEDKVCYWDLVFNDGSGEERDSSAASIAVCGLLELAKQLPLSDEKQAYYQETALTIMKSLSDHYTTQNTPDSNGLLLHGVYDKNSDKGVDECMIWGDYYYVEALTRLAISWYSYW